MNNKLITLFTQEMLKGVFGCNKRLSLYGAYEIVDHYLIEVDEVFATLAKAVDEGSIDGMLETKPRSDAFEVNKMSNTISNEVQVCQNWYEKDYMSLDLMRKEFTQMRSFCVL